MKNLFKLLSNKKITALLLALFILSSTAMSYTAVSDSSYTDNGVQTCDDFDDMLVRK